MGRQHSESLDALPDSFHYGLRAPTEHTLLPWPPDQARAIINVADTPARRHLLETLWRQAGAVPQSSRAQAGRWQPAANPSASVVIRWPAARTADSRADIKNGRRSNADRIHY